ncbi:anti-sigma factor [Mycoplana dimorpha]|uniref:Regulator of SigK n=1 Tax=Mycoplana dimorpha TaxID=28320 RepID=A0A2T5BEL4_MYCDI|nr:anti-sigma factor [Mycoplana dimorpha]PTM97432.1 anti-sigma-K factor RskA [Mycoplana dimorpha]
MTSPDQNSRDPRRDEVIAGEYVLGALSPEERRKVEARLRSDGAFAAMVNRWAENLSAFNQELETVPPPAYVYSAAERGLFEAPAQDKAPADQRRDGVWNSLALWRSLALFSLAAGVALAGPGLMSRQPSKQLITQLSGADNPISLAARYDAQSGELTMTPVAAGQDAARSLELWLLEDGKSPVSLGVLPQTGDGTLTVPEAMRPRLKGAVLAVSVEPPGGSPTGIATGPIIASGKARAF